MAEQKLTQREKETTREVIIGGVKSRVRKMQPSKEAIKSLGLRTRREIISHMPVNPPEIESQIRMLKANILREMARMTHRQRMDFAEIPIDFVKDKGDRQKYDIWCSRCGDKVATVWADNEKLDNWCDLHYICWYDKDSWRGALTVNVSPIDKKIGFECACGEDTRDFRANRALPPVQKQLMIEYSLKHREFGKSTSKFAAIAVR